MMKERPGNLPEFGGKCFRRTGIGKDRLPKGSANLRQKVLPGIPPPQSARRTEKRGIGSE